MHIAVCIKQILDPELPPRQLHIDTQSMDAEGGSASLVIGPFDLNALEQAVQLKEQNGAKVTAITAGAPEAKEALKRALAMGCDKAVSIEVGDRKLDGALTARLLAAAIRKLGNVDMVFCGRQAGDWDQGMVGSLLAEELELPAALFVRKVEVTERDTVRLEREVEGGWDVVEADTPVLTTITNSQENMPRLPKVKEIMMAGRKPMHHFGFDDLGLEVGGFQPLVEVRTLELPKLKGECEWIKGDSGVEKGEVLVRRLQEFQVI